MREARRVREHRGVLTIQMTAWRNPDMSKAFLLGLCHNLYTTRNTWKYVDNKCRPQGRRDTVVSNVLVGFKFLTLHVSQLNPIAQVLRPWQWVVIRIVELSPHVQYLRHIFCKGTQGAPGSSCLWRTIGESRVSPILAGSDK
jgi:hypothetical protein